MKPEEALDQVAYMRRLVERSRIKVSEFGPWFILWGVLWMVGYLGAEWLPAPARNWVWPGVYFAGFGLSFLSGARHQAAGGTAPDLLRKLGWISLALLGGSIALPFLFFAAPEQHIVNAYYPFVIGLIYIANGIFLGREVVAIGGWLVVAGAAAVWIPAPWQAIFLAVAGGGSLILTGLLLRRQVAWR